MERLQNLSAINTNTIEGRLLITALSKLASSENGEFPADIVLGEVQDLAELIYKEAGDLPTMPAGPKTFEEALSTVINQWSKENDSDTPDFILPAYISACLGAFAGGIRARDKWFNFEPWTGYSNKAAISDQPSMEEMITAIQNSPNVLVDKFQLNVTEPMTVEEVKNFFSATDEFLVEDFSTGSDSKSVDDTSFKITLIDSDYKGTVKKCSSFMAKATIQLLIRKVHQLSYNMAVKNYD